MNRNCLFSSDFRRSFALGALALAVSVAAVAQVATTTVHELPSSPKTSKAAKAAPKHDTDTLSSAPSNAGNPLLPTVFAGWQAAAPPKPLADAAQADAANTAAIKEYGFTDGLFGSYTRGSETLSLRALRFADATGAYGAYSFYRPSNWPKAEVGTGGAADHNRALFWLGNVVIDANFSQVTAMSVSELRELAKTIPVPGGSKIVPPPILGNLPQRDLEGQSSHYALGPAGYKGPEGLTTPIAVLPPELAGFDRGAEVVTANYSLSSGPATLTLLSYPTPQIAQVQEKQISDYVKAGNTPQHPWTKPLQDSNPTVIAVRRSGPLLVLISGDPVKDDAEKLLQSVHYEVEMSAIPGQPNREIQNYAKLILGIVLMVLVMFGIAVVIGVSLGSGRAVIRVLRGKPASTMYDDEFIRLDLRE